jgi:hypothetical protein
MALLDPPEAVTPPGKPCSSSGPKEGVNCSNWAVNTATPQPTTGGAESARPRPSQEKGGCLTHRRLMRGILRRIGTNEVGLKA